MLDKPRQYLVRVYINIKQLRQAENILVDTGYIVYCCGEIVYAEIEKIGICQHKIGKITREEIENLGLHTSGVSVFWSP